MLATVLRRALESVGRKVIPTAALALVAVTLVGGALAQNPVVPLEEWKSVHFTAEQLAASLGNDSAAPAGDGVPNILKYALGLTPFAPPGAALPEVAVAADHLALSYRHVAAAADVVCRVEVSPDLRVWSSGGAATGAPAVVALGGGMERVVVADLALVSGAGRRFLRLDASRTFVDADGNGLADAWETANFGHAGIHPVADPDGDGRPNRQEFLDGTAPTDFYNGVLPALTSLVPASGVPGPQGLIAVKVTRVMGGAVLANAPITFTATTAGTKVGASVGALAGASATVRADAHGVASAYVVFTNPSAENVRTTASSGALTASLDLALQAGVALPGAGAAGAVPSVLPSRLMVGLVSDGGDTWMKDSAVKWDVRYLYVTRGWRNNWGWDPTNSGVWVRWQLDDSEAAGCVPALTYYLLRDEPLNGSAGTEDDTLAKVQDVASMSGYFNDFKVFLQVIKAYGKPVIVHIEPDGFGLVEQQAAHDPNTPAAVASTGIPELQGLPNTVAGWGLAFLQLRRVLGVSNALYGIHISGWASDMDISTWNAAVPLQPEVDKVYNFLSPLGLAPNGTGQTWDLLVGDPLDRDADFHRIINGTGDLMWWDASDAAPINTRSFNRYAEWLRLWNLKSGKRWVLWQIPLGNSNHLNQWNDYVTPRYGYRDNRPEYFFAGSTDHLKKYADAGVCALLFGAGAGGCASYKNDTYTDGKLFLKSRAGAFLAAGGLPIAAGTLKMPAIIRFTATPASVRSGASVVLDWAVDGATLLSIAPSPGPMTSFGRVVTPATTTTYTLTATNAEGTTNAQVTVTVTP